MGLLFLLLSGCGDPISNALFYEDADFLVALPGRERFAGPEVLLLSTVGPSTLQQRGVEQAMGITTLLDPLALTGDVLRTTSPAVRTDDFRAWDATPIVREDGAQWWARAEINQPTDGPLTWHIDHAPEREGPWTPAAIGQQEAPNTGVFQYTVDDDGTERTFQGRYGVDTQGASSLELSLGLGRFGGDVYWRVSGDSSITWTGVFEFGEADPVLGVAQVAQTFTGGRAESVALTDDSLFFAECWDTIGNVVWSFGSVDGEEGREESCVLSSLFGEQRSSGAVPQ